MIPFILSSSITTFISIAVWIWTIVCMWIIFNKTWRKWWESIIPVWNVYVLFKIAGKKWWFRSLLLVPVLWILVSILFWITMQSWDVNEYSSLYAIKNVANWILWMLALIVPLMAWITMSYWLTKKFGQSNRFCVGILFLTPIFFWILAFSDAKYEWIEFTKKYSWKKWLLITLWIALVIGCCDAWIKYKEYKDYYSSLWDPYEYEIWERDWELEMTTVDWNKWWWRYEGWKKVWHRIEYESHVIKWEWDYNNNGEREWEWKIIVKDWREWWWKYVNWKQIWEWTIYDYMFDWWYKWVYNYNDEWLKEWEWKLYDNNGNLYAIWTYENWKPVWEWIYYRDDWTSTKLIFKDWKPWEWTMLIGQKKWEYNYKDGEDEAWASAKPDQRNQ